MDKTFIVTLTFRFPAWDEKDGIPYEVVASSKSAAVKAARRLADRDGHTVGRGLHWFKAEEVR